MDHETIIVGGGMAGMSCAMKLKEAGRDFLLITDRLGGRVCYSREHQINFGAVFYMENYHHAKKILTPGPRLQPKVTEIMLHNSEEDYFPALSLRMMKNGLQLARFFLYMRKFVGRYEKYKKDCETMPVEEAIDNNPYIKELYYRSAKEIISENGIDRVCDDFISKFAYACTGTSTDRINALDFLNVVQGVYMPIYEFSFDEEETAGKFGRNLLLDSVEKVTAARNFHQVTTAGGRTLQCRNLVIATPASVTRRLLGVNEIRKPTSLISYLIRGTLREKYAGHKFHYFSHRFKIIVLGDRENGKGEYMLFSAAQVDPGDYFSAYEVVKMQKWDEAMSIYGKVLLKQDFGNNIYTAGDHNGLGMEPACISGIFAANRIIAKS